MRLLYFLYFCRCKVVKDFRCKILRGKQVRILYSTRCCKFHQVEPQNVTVERREDAVPETSQKTCRCALLSLREVGGCKRSPNCALRSKHRPKHYVKLKCRGLCVYGIF